MEDIKVSSMSTRLPRQQINCATRSVRSYTNQDMLDFIIRDVSLNKWIFTVDFFKNIKAKGRVGRQWIDRSLCPRWLRACLLRPCLWDLVSMLKNHGKIEKVRLQKRNRNRLQFRSQSLYVMSTKRNNKSIADVDSIVEIAIVSMKKVRLPIKKSSEEKEFPLSM